MSGHSCVTQACVRVFAAQTLVKRMEKEVRWRSCAPATARRTNGCLYPPRALPDGQQATHNLIAVIAAASILRLQLLVDAFVDASC